jgi:hypothetical protein
MTTTFVRNRVIDNLAEVLAETDEEINQRHKRELAALYASLGDGVYMTRQPEYWKLSDRQKDEWKARSNARKPVKTDDDDENEDGSKTTVVKQVNLCRGCNEPIPPTGKRGRPAIYHESCRP